jgi:two-component system phosphate regulon response regulator PhoB
LITTTSKILVHCNNQDELAALATKLRRKGFQAIDARIPAEVLSAVEDETPNIIITDTDTDPGVGLNLVRELKRREQTQDIPIFLIVGDKASSLEKEAVDAGADGFLSVPERQRSMVLMTQPPFTFRPIPRM